MKAMARAELKCSSEDRKCASRIMVSTSPKIKIMQLPQNEEKRDIAQVTPASNATASPSEVAEGEVTVDQFRQVVQVQS